MKRLIGVGLTGVIIGLAAHHIAKNLLNINDEDQEETHKKSKTKKPNPEKTANFNSIIMNCQLNSIISNEGISLNNTRANAIIGKFSVLEGNKFMQNIFSYLEISDLCYLKSVCKQWKNFIEFMLKNKHYLRKCAIRGFNNKNRGKYWLIISKCSIEAYEEKKFLIMQSKSTENNESSKKTELEREKQIEKDINRTLEIGINFKNEDTKRKLKKILRKYCSFDTRVGYVQGMNFITAHILLHLNENETFSFLRTLLFEYDVRSIFFKYLPRLKLSLYQFDLLIQKYLPIVYERFKRIGLRVDMFSSDWFLTLFSYSFPQYFTDRVWDIFLIEGWPILFSIGIVLLMRNQRKLLSLSFEDCLQYLKKLKIREFEVKNIIKKAFLINVNLADLDLFHRKYVDKKLFLS